PRLLLEKVQRDLGVQANGELALPVLVTRALEGALEPPRDDLGREDPPAGRAGGAVGRHRVPERRPYALPGHLHQAKLGDGQRLGARPVAAEVRAQLLEDLVAVGARLHVDEVAHDDTADVPETNLAGDLS